MSDKFNRNDSNAEDDQFLIGDYQADINGIEEDLRLSAADLHEMPCIISGLAVTLNANNISVDVAAGVAYDNEGKRISVPLAESGLSADTTLGAVNYICLAHDYSYSSSRNAYKTGALYYAKKSDSYQIVVKTEAEGPPGDLEDAGFVLLATTTGTGSELTISSTDRTRPDFGGAEDAIAPAQVIGVSLATGSELSLLYPTIQGQFVENDVPNGAYITVNWSPVSDPSGILRYEVEMVPLDGDDNDLPDYLQSGVVAYNQV